MQWYKTNPMPNFKGTRFTNATETLLWCKKSEIQKTYTFNYRLMKHLNDGKQMKSVWEIPLCGGNERLRDKDGVKLHSTQKPEELLKRVILSSSNEGDIVLDPFFGSGTTGAAAKKLRRNFIGIEKEAKYVQIALERINNIKEFAPELSINIEEKKSDNKVPFKTLIDCHYLSENEVMYFKGKSEFQAIVQKDGFINYKNITGSIHKVGALIQNSPSCNGWTTWQVKKGKDMIYIDELRKQYNKERAFV